ncbi:MAG: hypothetical protein VKK04_12920 [Synechococcales bacterium]|nr:hypothetical protein [Synechococcales bacterium]
MLLFFIHGVATRHTGYAKDLARSLKDELVDRGLPAPICYPSFWGDLLNDIHKLWSNLHKDLQRAREEGACRTEDALLRYQDFREGLFSEFVGDFFSYFNEERGRKIRQKLALQLEDFLTSNSNDPELHIIAHSLGTVILWDALLSNRLDSEPETQKLRKLVRLCPSEPDSISAKLISITTMGSPIVFANQMLGVGAEEWQRLLSAYRSDCPLRWTNIVHPSDIIAYPITATINDTCGGTSEHRLVVRDCYVRDEINLIEKTAETFGQSNLGMAFKAGEAHVSYFKEREHNLDTVQAIIQTLLNDSSFTTDRHWAIAQLRQCPGITPDYNPENIKAAETQTVFKDGSGSVTLFVNPAQIHHVYVSDDREKVVFGAYVGWIHTKALKTKLAAISKYKVRSPSL